MTEEMNHVTRDTFDQLVEHYLGLESMEVTEELLDLCGASIDTRALALLKRRLQRKRPRSLSMRHEATSACAKRASSSSRASNHSLQHWRRMNNEAPSSHLGTQH